MILEGGISPARFGVAQQEEGPHSLHVACPIWAATRATSFFPETLRSVAGARLVSGPWADGLAAELLWGHIGYDLGQLPAVASEIHSGAVPLAILSVDRRFNHDGAMVSGASERVGDVGYADPNNLRDHARFRGALVTATSAMITAPSSPMAIWAR